MKRINLSLAGLFFIFALASPQKSPEKFGKNIAQYFENEECSIDSSAGAFVIFDFGNVNFDYSDIDGFTWTLTRHTRMKILDKSELDKASFSIPKYDYSPRESIIGFKAVSYNMENGKLVEDKISSRDIIIEKSTDYWSQYKFALNNVKEGTVIEVQYKLKSPFELYLRDWDFQRSIPVMHSEVWIRIPEFFYYHQNMKGYHPLTIGEIISERGSLIARGNAIPYEIQTKHFVANNIPALKDEEYVDNMDNYKSSVEFELSHIKFLTKITEFTTSWDAVVNRLLESDNFKFKLDKVGYAKDKIEELKLKYPDKTELANAIYYYVQSHIKWNERYGFSDNNTLREVYNKNLGSTSEINFILINMLHEAGISAIPAALSTRQNGIIMPSFPTLDNLNYIIALVQIDNQNILMDASSSHCPPGVLPYRCLNGRGRTIHEQYNQWINLKPVINYDDMTMYDLKIDEMGDFNGNIMSSKSGYASISFRNKMDNSLNEEKMMEEMEEDYPGLEILTNEFKGLENPYGPVQEIYEVNITERTSFMGDMISFNPVMFERHDDNPFKLEKRSFPVNYAYPRNYKNLFKYQLPEGYTIESLPSPINIALPENGGRYIYSATQVGNMLNVSVMLQINKDVYLPSEYAYLKEFYNQLVAKEAEQVILKKTVTP